MFKSRIRIVQGHSKEDLRQRGAAAVFRAACSIRRSTFRVLLAACKMNFLCLSNPYSISRWAPPVPPDRPRIHRDSPKIILFSTLNFDRFLKPKWNHDGSKLDARTLPKSIPNLFDFLSIFSCDLDPNMVPKIAPKTNNNRSKINSKPNPVRKQ